METILTKIVIFFSNHRFVSPKLIYSSKIIYDPDKILFNHFAIILLVCVGGGSSLKGSTKETFNSREYI